MPFTPVRSELVYDTPTPMSQAALSQGAYHLHISGQVAQDRNGALVGEGDVEAQALHALDGIRALTEKAGGTLADVVRITVYVTAREHFATVMEVRRRVFSTPYPATTAVMVAGLGKPEWLVEIEATAVITAAAGAGSDGTA